ncbi:MAG: hypothetical protein ACYTGN_13870 [Planctomycetota bacterium]|jgi:hypothetical protein
MRTITALLLCVTFANADEFDDAVKKLFNADAASREQARATIVAAGEQGLKRLLDTLERRVAAKAALIKDAPVLRFYDIKDLTNDKLSAARVRKGILELGQRVEIRQGVLVVNAAPSVHARIAKILGDVRKAAGPFVLIETKIVKGVEDTGIPRYVSRKKLAGWLETVEVTTAPALTCRNGQRADVSVLEQVSYIADFDIEVAKGKLIADPVVKTIDVGERISLRPFVKRIGIRVAVDALVTELTLPMHVERIEGLDAEMQLPEIRASRCRTVVMVDDDQVAIVPIGQGRALVVQAKRIRIDND